MSNPAIQRELQVGGAVPPDKIYIVRRTDAELLRALEEGEYCNVLCPRQMGKTSAIIRICTALRNEGCRTARVDIAGCLGTPTNADDWYLGLLGEFRSQFKLKCDVKAWWANRSEPTANQRLLAFFREQMLARTSNRFVIFLDEIDHTINLTYTDDFFVAIRSLYNDRAEEPDLRRLAFCLVGVFTPNELVKQQRTTTYNIGRSFELEDFHPDHDDLSQLAGALSTNPAKGQELLRVVLGWTGGQPYLTVSICEKIAAAGIDSPKAVNRLIEDVFLTFEKPLDHSDGTHFENISHFLGQRVSARLETADLYCRILRGHTERASLTPAVVALKLSGLVKVDRNGRLVVRNEIYRRRFDADWAMAVLSIGKVEPLEDLVLELTDLRFHEQAGVRRASARARLIYESAMPGQRQITSIRSWRFVAPIGMVEAGELRWYLENYAVWPSLYFRDRARKVEKNLVRWGQLLHEAAMPVAYAANVINAWDRIGMYADRRFSVHVDAALEAGAPEVDVKAAKETATLLLGLPWELLHDGSQYLFQGATPTRVRRRLPGTEVFDIPIVTTPIRILLVTARPEDDACGYIDHRATAQPLIEAMEALPDLVEIHVLNPPTLQALHLELDRARKEERPFHVVHFDGHGVYDKQVGLGGLCFEHPEDTDKLEMRRHATVFTSELGPLLRDHRIPLVFLEATQTAQAEMATESVASEILQVGVASVVAMSHSVLVETSRRFVESFYRALAAGKRVGDAMLAGQRQLKDDTFRGRIFGAGELRLEDWFVPVLFQEKDDPQLFKTTPAKQTVADFQAALAARLGGLPPAPETGFVGRSRELLALQRLLRHERYAVVRGQGGEGKTALAAEFARWMVRSQQMRRAAFVSVETHSHTAAVLDAIGSQLVPGYSVATFADLERALHPIDQALSEQPTLLVVDNMDSILLPPFIETPQALSEDAHRELTAILQLCTRLNATGDTRLVFTSREPLPAPFDAARQRRELHQLDRMDAVKLVERVLNVAGGDVGGASDAAIEQIEQLVDDLHCHARTLTLLAPALREGGVEATRQALVALMAEMEKQFPGSREKSVFASVELSLRRMSPANRERAQVLGMFHGGVQLGVLGMMMQWEEADVGALAGELVATGLATPNRYNHLSLNPALCPYLRGRLDSTQRQALTARWIEVMGAYARFLEGQRGQNAEMAATLTVLELPNLFALLELVQGAGEAEATIDLATSLYSLLENAGKPRLLVRVGQVRDAAARQLETLGDAWNHARFEAARSRIEQQLAGGGLRQAFEGTQALLQRARAAGEQAYPGADYDLAMAHFTLARVLKTAGGAEQALPLLDEARQRFEALAKKQPGQGAERMASVCLTEQGDCLRALGRLDEAAAAYEESIRRAEQLDDTRQVAASKGQLGTVRLQQRRYTDALDAYEEARQRFTQMDEPGTVAVVWHQTGIAYQEAGQPEAAEDAYRKSLAIMVRLGDVAGQANTLTQLGLLYDDVLGRTEEAVAFLRQALDKDLQLGDVANEGKDRYNLAIRLHKLRRLDEARQEIRRAIECDAQFGHAAEPWKTWAILAGIETDADNPAAAAQAQGKAIACYLAYRRDGGENHDAPGRISLAVTQSLLAGDPAQAASLLQQLANNPQAARLLPFIRALQAIVAGNRERALADAPDLHYTMAAEILFLIETLEARPELKAR